MTEDRMAALRGELARATGSGERLPVLAAMIELAAELRKAGSDDDAGAAALDEALLQLAASAASPADAGEYAMTLYLIAQACIMRDAGSDLDDAIRCLLELRDGLGADAPDLAAADNAPDLAAVMTEIQVNIGGALYERASRPGGRAADVDDASAALAAALDRMAPEHPRRAWLTAALAWQYADRYAGFNGTEDHRAAALSHAAACLASVDPADDTAARCHVIIAWMTLTRQLTGEQRSAMLRRGEIEAARRGGPGAAAMLAAFGTMEIALPDAQTALSHLRQVFDAAVTDEALRDIVPALSSLAALSIMNAGGVTEDIDRVADDLRRAARWAAEHSPPETPEPGELLAMRAALLAARSSQDGRQGGLKPIADALHEAAARLPEGHLIRAPLLNQLQQVLWRQVSAAESADDIAAEVERVMETLEQMPRDDPQFARMLTFAAVHLLGVQLSHRSAVPLDRVISHLDQTVQRLAPDDQMRFLGESVYWGAIATKAAIEHRPDRIKAATTELKRCADRVPQDSVIRAVVLLDVGSALIDLYAMTGELRQLEQAQEYVGKASAALAKTEPAARAAGRPDEPGSLHSTLHVLLIYLRSLLKIVRIRHEPEGLDLTETVADLERAVGLMKPGDALRPRLVAELEMARVWQQLSARSRGLTPTLGRPERESFEKIVAQARSIGRDHPDFPALAGQAAGALMLRGVADSDVTAMGQAISLLAEACAVPGLTYRERPRLLNLHGSALLTRHHLTRDQRDLSNAIDRLEQARRAVEQEVGSPYAADVLQSLASAYRTRGDRAVTVGLDALRENAGDVLLQDSDENALRAARGGTSDAGEMARWFLRHGRTGAAIGALELGRGMVLHAATSGPGLAEVLEDAGHAGLAAEWASAMASGATAESDAVSDLRYRIMLAIEGSPAEARLLSPPSLPQIRAALTECGADALVYLLPRDEDGPGPAVLGEPGGTGCRCRACRPARAARPRRA